MHARLVLAAFLFALSSSAGAALLTIAADIGIYENRFEDSAVTPYLERGYATWLFNTAGADSLDSPTASFFAGSIIGFSLQVDQRSRDPLRFILNSPGDITFGEMPFGDGTYFRMNLTAMEVSGAFGGPTLWTFLFQGHANGYLWSDGTFMTSEEFWRRAIGQEMVASTPGEVAYELDYAPRFQRLALIPVPLTSALLASGLVALALVHRRTAVS